MPMFHYTVDDEPQSTDLHQMTPRQILTNAGIDSASHYLVQIHGNQKISYENKLDEAIQMHQHMKFISVSTGPTPVS
jgi:phosphoribosylanthranilate isomerase